MKILIVGGHLAPALSVIDALPKTDTVIFVGRKHVFEGDPSESLEYKEITKRGIPFVQLRTGRLQRKLSRRTLPSLLKTPGAVFQAIILLKKWKPDVVIGFGGYLSLPVGFASAMLRIPLVIHEQTMEAGLANKLLARFATKICISWESSKSFFPERKVVLTGNPLRVVTGSPKKLTPPLLYVTGGSGGSHALNMLIEACAERLLERYQIFHQTGDAKAYHDFDRLSDLKKTLSSSKQKRYTIVKFVDPSETGKLMLQASLVIGRSGINTVTELLLYETPALLIPLPHTQRNEQEKNATFLKRQHLAEVLKQEHVTADELIKTIATMMTKRASYRVSDSMLHSLHLQAGKRIVEVIHNVAKEKTDSK